MDDLTAIDELELGEGEDALAVERGLEGEVEAGKRLDRRQAAHAQRRLDATVLAQVSSSASSDVDHLERADLAAVRAGVRVVERLQGARHPQGDQVRRMRSSGQVSGPTAIMARPPRGEPAGDRLVEVQRAGATTIAGAATGAAVRRRWLLARAASCGGRAPRRRWWRPSSTGWTAISRPSSKMRISSARLCTSTDAFAGGIGHAVEIAADADHALMRDPPLELQHGAERHQRQGRRWAALRQRLR